LGEFYVNYVIRSDDRSAVVAALQGRKALVTPVQQGCVLATNEESIFQDGKEIENLTCFLSLRLSCPVLAFIMHDGDLLCYCLAQEGAIDHSYTSCFGYFDAKLGDLPRGGNARALCSAFGSPEHERVERILRKPDSSDEHDLYSGSYFASERHADLVAALGIPAFSVGFGYNHGGFLPDGFTEDELIHTD
jgi:hypothetical protein